MSKSKHKMTITEKFRKDLVKFYDWAKETMIIKDQITKKELTYEVMLLPDFKEPGRNKLDTYIKELLKKYNVMYKEEVCDDYKLISNDFKLYKTSKNKKSIREVHNIKQNSKKIIKEPISPIIEKELDEEEIKELSRTTTEESQSIEDILKEIDEIIVDELSSLDIKQ